MAYTVATPIQRDQPNEGRIRYVIEFTGSGETPVQREFFADGSTTPASAAAWARGEAERLNNRKATIAAIELRAPFDLSPPAGPSQADLDRRAWALSVRRLENALRLVTAGALASNDAGLATLRTSVQAAFAGLNAGQRAAYLDEM